MSQVVVWRPGGRARLGGSELLEQVESGEHVWIDLEGFGDESAKTLAAFGFHPLAIEDTFTLQHQPKLQEFDDHLFVIARGVDFNQSKEELATLKLAAFLSENRLVTVHRSALRSLTRVRDRIRERSLVPKGAPLVLQAILDELIDLFTPFVEQEGERIEELEEEILKDAKQAQLETVQVLRRRMATLRRALVPNRQVLHGLANLPTGPIDEPSKLYFRDVHDSVLRLTDAIDQHRDQLANLKDTWMSVVAQRTNEVMKVLALLSAVLLPVTFIAGVYGMNFANMPELGTKYGYFVTLGVMSVVAVGMLAWFRAKRWF